MILAYNFVIKSIWVRPCTNNLVIQLTERVRLGLVLTDGCIKIFGGKCDNAKGSPHKYKLHSKKEESISSSSSKQP